MHQFGITITRIYHYILWGCIVLVAMIDLDTCKIYYLVIYSEIYYINYNFPVFHSFVSESSHFYWVCIKFMERKYYNIYYINVCQLRRAALNDWYSRKLCQAYMFGHELVVDCGFEDLFSSNMKLRRVYLDQFVSFFNYNKSRAYPLKIVLCEYRV